jgi:hypothetical protein
LYTNATTVKRMQQPVITAHSALAIGRDRFRAPNRSNEASLGKDRLRDGRGTCTAVVNVTLLRIVATLREQ